MNIADNRRWRRLTIDLETSPFFELHVFDIHTWILYALLLYITRLKLAIWLVSLRSVQAVWTSQKPYWTTNSNLGREWSGTTYSDKNHWQVTDNSPRNHRRFSENFPTFSGNVFGLSQNWASSDNSSVFRKFSNKSPKIFWHIHGGYTIKLLLTKCSFHTENIRTLVFVRTSFIRSVRQNCGLNIALWTSQLVNKTIKSYWHRHVKISHSSRHSNTLSHNFYLTLSQIFALSRRNVFRLVSKISERSFKHTYLLHGKGQPTQFATVKIRSA